MEIKSRKNSYGHERLDCPYCSKEVYVRRSSENPAREMLQHMTREAKNEALEILVEDLEPAKANHLGFYKTHTTKKEVKVAANQREYSIDSIRIIE